jgi:hypothetical protein
MKHFEIRAGALFAEDVPLESVAAEYGTPTFVYSRAALVSAHAGYTAALAGRDSMLCYAVKSNSNLAIMNVFARLGTGFDIVSGGELSRVLAAGGDPGKVVFSGVGKTRDEMRAALTQGIYCFNVESEAELYRLAEVARQPGQARADRAAGQSGCRSEDAPLHFHRTEVQQVRCADHWRARALSYRRRTAATGNPRHRLPHRFAAARPGASGGGGRQGGRAGRSTES